MDINMPTLNGIEATRQIVDQVPGTTVFLCSTYQRADLPPEAETSGFAAYVNKEELGPDLLRRLWDERQPPADPLLGPEALGGALRRRPGEPGSSAATRAITTAPSTGSSRSSQRK